jgi:hypothetical protein
LYAIEISPTRQNGFTESVPAKLPSKKNATLVAPLVVAQIVNSVPTTSCLTIAPSVNASICWGTTASNNINSMGELLGAIDRVLDGSKDGTIDGKADGNDEGIGDMDSSVGLGWSLSKLLGCSDGPRLGISEGCELGNLLAVVEGTALG